jgi:hypothetical protein
MASADDPDRVVIHYFVDEAGTPTLFDAQGKILIGAEGCSSYFMLGKIDIDASESLGRDLADLRAHLLADPYFNGVPSMQPEGGKTAIAFHAKDDVPTPRAKSRTRPTSKDNPKTDRPWGLPRFTKPDQDGSVR